MEYIDLSELGLEESKSMFLGVDEPSNLDQHIHNIKASDILFADLDSCIADCLAEKLPIYDIASKRIFDKDYWGWGFRTVSRLTKIVKGAELEDIKEESWKDYHENVLGKDGNLEKLEILATSKMPDLLYPGTEKFFEQIPDVYKQIVTRNIAELTRPFADYLGFDSFEIGAYDKDEGLSRIRNPYAHTLKYVFVGDHITFQKAKDWLRKYKHKSTKIYVFPDRTLPEDIAHDVNIHIARDFTPLAHIMQEIEKK